jgi:hypothetical protein
MKTVIEAREQKTLENLVKAKDDIAVKYAEDKISESRYKILREKISESVDRINQAKSDI